MPALNPAGKSKQVRAKLREVVGNRGGSRRDSGAGAVGSCQARMEDFVRDFP